MRLLKVIVCLLKDKLSIKIRYNLLMLNGIVIKNFLQKVIKVVSGSIVKEGGSISNRFSRNEPTLLPEKTAH